jgi:hypothetical protein
VGQAIVRCISVLLLTCCCACNSGDGQAPADGAPDAGPAVDGPNPCPPGLEPYKTACVPVFDTCAENEVPLLGGGCKRVGVEACDGGLKGPPDWTCTPIGPPTTCPTGWSTVAGGWCEPTVPAGPCPAGSMKVIGKTSCQPVGDCGSGTWGAIKTGASTIFVDQAYTGSDSDGSQAKPYTTITQALQQAASGAQIAVAAGDYAEEVSISKQVTIEGRCAEKVKIKGQGYAAVSVTGASVELRGLTVTGASSGIYASGATLLGVHLAVSGCGNWGILANLGTKLTLQDALVQGNTSTGIWLVDGEATLERVDLRQTAPDPNSLQDGQGLYVSADKALTQVTVRDSVIQENTSQGIELIGAKAVVDGCLISDNKSRPKDGTFGEGIFAMTGSSGQPAALDLRSSVVANNNSNGVFANSSQVKISNTVVRDTQPDNAGNEGMGIWINVGGSLELQDSLLYKNRGVGVYLSGADGTIAHTLVRGTLPLKTPMPVLKDLQGAGIASVAEAEAELANLDLTDCLVEDNAIVGIGLINTNGTIQRTLVRNTVPNAITKTFGVGILSGPSSAKTPTLALEDCALTDNHYAALFLYETDTTIARTVVRDTEPAATGGKFGHGVLSYGMLKNAELSLEESVVAYNAGTEVFLLSTNGVLDQVLVVDSPDQAPEAYHVSTGVVAFPVLTALLSGEAPTLTVRRSLVANHQMVGVQLSAVEATVEQSAIRNTLTTASGAEFGDGLSVEVLKEVPKVAASLTVTDSLVEKSARAGLLARGAGGSVSRSVFREGVFPIALEQGAPLKPGPDNVYELNEENTVSYAKGLTPAPLPTTPSPPGLP